MQKVEMNYLSSVAPCEMFVFRSGTLFCDEPCFQKWQHVGNTKLLLASQIFVPVVSLLLFRSAPPSFNVKV
jgi:hypothetical protein